MRRSRVIRLVSIALYAPLLVPCLPFHLTKAAQQHTQSQGNFGAPGAGLPDLNRVRVSKSEPPALIEQPPQEPARAADSGMSGIPNEAPSPTATTVIARTLPTFKT